MIANKNNLNARMKKGLIPGLVYFLWFLISTTLIVQPVFANKDTGFDLVTMKNGNYHHVTNHAIVTEKMKT